MMEDLALMEEQPELYGVPPELSEQKRRRRKRTGVSTAKKRSPPSNIKDFEDATENEGTAAHILN
jgi:hypothetical protein